MSLQQIVNRIHIRLEKTSQAPATASKAAGLSDSAIRNLERRLRAGTGKAVQQETVEKLAKPLRTTAEWLLFGTGPEEVDGARVANFEVAGLPVLGKIQAGVWFDTALVGEESEPEVLPVALDPRFPHARQYCLEVVGDSMNELYPDHSFVVAVDFAESGLKLKTGQVLHIERRRYDGQIVENTLKQVDMEKGTLVPRSSNPVHQAFPISAATNGRFEDTEVIVRGIVLSGLVPSTVV